MENVRFYLCHTQFEPTMEIDPFTYWSVGFFLVTTISVIINLAEWFW